MRRTCLGVNRLPRICLAALALILALAGCDRLRDWWPGQRPNVLIITLDTTRADHLGCYGYQEIETPTLDRLAAEGVRFARVYAAAPITLPSHTSIMTGTYPIFHGVRNNGTYQVDPSITTAAEIFKSHGYQTAAFIASFPLLGRFGLNQGFDLYDDHIEAGREKQKFLFQERRAGDVNKAAIAWLEQKSKPPFFMWVHYFDPHFSYDPPSPFHEKYFFHLYDGEIAYVDSQLQKLLDAFQERGWLDNTLVAVTADHGESLGEHKEKTHAMLIYYGTEQVPLILWAPQRWPARTVVTDMVRSIDILPTLLDYTGFKPFKDIQGVSLRPLIEGKQKTLDLVAYTESLAPYLHFRWSPLEGIRDNRYLYIKGDPEELYDLNQDPKEIHELSAAQPKPTAELRQTLERVRKQSENPKPLNSLVKLDQETQDRLRSLGYVFSAVKPPAPGEKLKNPRFAVEILEDFFMGQSALAREDFDKAIGIFDVLLQKDPEFGQAYLERGVCYARNKDFPAALQNYQQAEPLLSPDDAELAFNQAMAYILMRDVKQAEPYLFKVLKTDPSNSLAYIYLARIRGVQRKPNETLQFLLKATQANPQSEIAHFELGRFYLMHGKVPEAKEEFLQSKNANPNFPGAAFELGKLQYETGEKERGAESIEEALKRDPKMVPAHAFLAQIYLDQDAPQKAQAHLDIALALNPNSDEAHFTRGNLLVKQGKLDEAFQEFQKTVELNPNHALARKNLGASYAIRGDAKNAIENYQLSLRLMPNQPQADKIKAAIEELQKNGAPVKGPGPLKPRR